MSEQFDISFENAQGELVDAIKSKNRFATLCKNIATICSKSLISGNGEGQQRNNEEGDTEQHNIPDIGLLDGGKQTSSVICTHITCMHGNCLKKQT